MYVDRSLRLYGRVEVLGRVKRCVSSGQAGCGNAMRRVSVIDGDNNEKHPDAWRSRRETHARRSPSPPSMASIMRSIMFCEDYEEHQNHDDHNDL